MNVRFCYLCVSTHDLASFLVKGLTGPLWVQFLQLPSQAVVFTHEQCVNRRESHVLIHTDVTCRGKRIDLLVYISG